MINNLYSETEEQFYGLFDIEDEFEDEDIDDDDLEHYGMPRRSGRYPWGSGENPYQRSGDWLARVEQLQKQGKNEKQIAESFEISTTDLRAYRSIAINERRYLLVKSVKSMKGDGYSNIEIAKKLGLKGESTVRSLLKESSEKKMNQAQELAEYLKVRVTKKGMVDVGKYVNKDLNASREKLDQALSILQAEGYPVYNNRIPQPTNPNKKTVLKVLCKPGTEYKEIYNTEKIFPAIDRTINDVALGETSKQGFIYPASLDSNRVQVRYADDKNLSGAEQDGLIELRRGVDDISLGNANYSQVRILVDGTHYIKGMAVYSDNMPDGVDVIFNTNKKSDTPMIGPKDNSVLKPIKNDPENPFGSLIKEEGGQSYCKHEKNPDGTPKLRVINKRADEGDWGEWSHDLPSQFLSKQNQKLIDQQLKLAINDAEEKFDDINSLNNPVIRKYMLNKAALKYDKAAVNLKAAALPRQKYQVIIPLPGLKDNEIYAPNYVNGEKVALIRYPHGGTFEIPILTVNNKNKSGEKRLGKNPLDAVGINSKVAERLSGADFDGDTVMVIPTGGKIDITSTKSLKGLEGFDPKKEYPYEPGMRVMSESYKQRQMGEVSNLINDMTLKGAKPDDIAKAVRHSMVVIDAVKHNLNYKKSEIDNDILTLKKKWQAKGDGKAGGASTLISLAKSSERVAKRQGTPKINIKGKDWYDPTKPEGSLIFKTADDLEYKERKPVRARGEDGKYLKDSDGNYIYETYKDDKGNIRYKYDYTGKILTRTQESTKMDETHDATTLISDYHTPQEVAYAKYANHMKALANKCRLTAYNISTSDFYDKAANQRYGEEVKSLMNKLDVSEANAPRERRALALTNSRVLDKMAKDKDLTKSEIKKITQQELVKARIEAGAKRTPVSITSNEWEAIQSGAIRPTVLERIMNHVDDDRLKELATPKSNGSLSQAKINLINSMVNSNYTNDEIAKRLGISASQVVYYMKKGRS